MTYDNPWTFDGIEFTDKDIGDSIGFVYVITNLTTHKKYIGRKYFYSTRKQKRTDTRRKTKPSDWKTYYSSSDDVLAEVEKYGTKNFRREILSLHKTKGDTNINEVKEQFSRNVLEDDIYLNANINGKWRRPPNHIINARRYHR